MTNSTLPMLHAHPIGGVATKRKLLWLQLRDRWVVPVSIALIPIVLLVLSGELGRALHLSWLDGNLRAVEFWALEVGRWLVSLHPLVASLAGVLLAGYLVVGVGGMRWVLRECYPQTWMRLTRRERNEFEVLASASEAVDELGMRVAAMDRALVLQDLVQARLIARSTTRRARPRSGRDKLATVLVRTEGPRL